MANLEGKNFTDFRNINVRGDGYVGGAPSGALAGAAGSPAMGGMIRFTSAQTAGGLVGGTGAWDSTLALQNFGGASVAVNTTTDEVPYLSIANAGLNIGTGYIRYTPFGGANAGTLSVNTTYNDTDRAWTLPSKSGVFPISGTFSVDVPIIASSGYVADTVVTVAGIRAEDGVTLTPLNNGAAAAVMSARGFAIPINVVPGNGNLTITFANPFGTATIFRTSIYGYTAVR